MVDKHLSDRQLDDAIDRAVRDLMRVEPRADLRARVLAELDDAPARLALWPRLAFGGAALAVAAVLVAMLAPRPAVRPDEGRIADTRPPLSSPAPAPPAPPVPQGPRTPSLDNRAHHPSPPPAILVPDLPRANEDRVIRAASLDTLNAVDATIADGPPTVEPLQSISPISIATLGVAATSTPTIAIKPINVDQIDITPLAPQR